VTKLVPTASKTDTRDTVKTFIALFTVNMESKSSFGIPTVENPYSKFGDWLHDEGFA
jgi:hypothetical protein